MPRGLKSFMKLSEIKLKEAKPLIKLFALDYDGTIYDGVDYNLSDAMELIEKILMQDKSIAFITARAVTAVKTFAPPLQEFLKQQDTAMPVFIAGGNGTILYKVEKNNLIKIYNNGLNIQEIIQAIDAWKKVYEKLEINIGDLAEKGLKTFRKFLKENWIGYIPDEIFKLCQPYKGKIFTEEAKVTFVLPKDENQHQEIIRSVGVELGKNYSIAAGDKTFVHITKRLKEDGKIVAVETILKLLNLKINQVATFGDMPTGNDKGLLSFPYSFTNSEEFVKVEKDFQQPPFILTNSNVTAVGRVYKAIDYLLF